jgi:S1-C subfamily serine protease
LQAGDLITQIDGKSVQGLQHVKARLAAAEAGKAIPLEIWRRGSVVTSSVTPILASELNRRLRGTTAPIVTVQGWGFRCTVGSGNRPLVTNVAPQSLAARAGIQTGDLIVGLNVGKGLQAVRQLDDLRRLKQASGRVIIALWRQGRVTTTTVQL